MGRVDSIDSELNKCTSSSSEGCVFQVNFEYPKELRELRNNYPLAPHKI